MNTESVIPAKAGIVRRLIPAFAGMTILVFLGLPLIKLAIASDLTPWMEANTKYQSGDFKGALALYEKILESG